MAVLNTGNSERKKEERKSVLNTVLHTQRIVKSFSVKKDDFNTLATFIEISQREDPDFSTTVIRSMREYVQRHAIPNPQAQLDRMLEIGLPHKPSWQCCVEGCKRKVRYRLRLKDYQGKVEQFPVCDVHKRWRHPHFRFLIGYKEIQTQT